MEDLQAILVTEVGLLEAKFVAYMEKIFLISETFMENFISPSISDA